MDDLILVIVTCAIVFCIYRYGIKPKREKKKNAANKFSERPEKCGGMENGGTIPPLDVSGMGLGLNRGVYSSLAGCGGGVGVNPLYMATSSLPSPVRLRFQLALLELADADAEDGEDVPEMSEGTTSGISEAAVRQIVCPAVDRILAALYNRGAYGVRLSFAPIGTKLMVFVTYELPASEL